MKEMFGYFLILLCIASPLFPDSDWDEWEEYDDPTYVSYNGLWFTCDLGCGDPKEDFDAACIYFLCRQWLSVPLSSQIHLNEYYVKKLGLEPWEHHSVSGGLYDFSIRNSYYYYFNSVFYDDEEFIHKQFVDASSAFLSDIDDIIFECEKDHEYYLEELEIVQKVHLEEYDPIDWRKYCRIAYRNGEYSFSGSLCIERVLKSVQKEIEISKINLEANNLYRKYVQDTCILVDLLYRKIFTWCLENHQPEGVAFQAALEDFILGDLDAALEQTRCLIDIAEKEKFNDEIVSKIYFIQGGVANEMALYSDAIVSLTKAVQKNPEYKEAYFERARAYFELGQFETAFQDFLTSDVKSTPINIENANFFDFACGIMKGTSLGAVEGVTEFVPSLLTSLKTLGSGIWSFAQDPVRVSSEFVQSSQELLQSVRFSRETIEVFIPELKELVNNWNDLSSFQQGEQFGHILGKYGIDILLTLGTSYGAKAYVDFRRATALHTFETYAKSEINASQIAQIAKNAQLKREACEFVDKSYRLKNAQFAEIKQSKITRYALADPEKSKGFTEILGFNESNWKDLKVQIQKGVLENKAKFNKIDQYGVKFSVDIPIMGPKGTGIVRTGWIYRENSLNPDLTTLYLYTKKIP